MIRLGCRRLLACRPISLRSGLPLLTGPERIGMRQNVTAVTARAIAM
jgi:hypothetical protein